MKLETFKFRSRGKGVKGQTFEAAVLGKVILNEEDGCVDDIEYKIDELPTELEMKDLCSAQEFDFREVIARGFNSMSKAMASNGGQASIVTSWIIRDKLVTEENTEAAKIKIRAIVTAVLGIRKGFNKELPEAYELAKLMGSAK